MSAPLLAARNLTLRFGRRTILDGVSFEVSSGDLAALLGQNGAGKTSLLRILLGVVNPTAGEVSLLGKPLQSWSRRELAGLIAYVPQSHAPTFPYTVREIVGMGRSAASGWGRRLNGNDEKIVAGALASLQIADLADRSYGELSGGERQATLVARALAQEARIVLMDEPAASLDLGQRARLISLLSNLAEAGFAILVSLHQPEIAGRFFNRALLLHEGRILSEGAPREILTDQYLSRLYDVEVARLEVSGEIFFSATPASNS